MDPSRLAIEMLDAVPEHPKQFSALFETYMSTPEIRPLVNSIFLELAQIGSVAKKRKAIELLGILKVKESEPILKEQYEKDFPPRSVPKRLLPVRF